MSEELHSADKQNENRGSTNRKRKVDDFKLKIDYSDDLDNDIIFPEETDEDLLDLSDDDNKEHIAVPRRRSDLEEDISEKDENRRRRKALKNERRRKKKKAKQNGCVIRVVWLVMVLILGVFLAEFLLVGINDLLGRNRGEEEKIIIQVPDDADIEEISDILYDNGVISNKSYFKFYAKLTNGDDGFAKGSYEMKNNMDYEAIINYLQSNANRVDTVQLRFTEGMTVLEIADKLSENGVCDKDEFLELCNSTDFDEDFTFLASGRPGLNNVYYRLEGYLFPDTYEFYQGESARTSIYRFLNNYESKLYYTKMRIEIKEDSDEDYYDYYNEEDTDTSKKKTKKYEKLTVEEQAKKQGMTMDEVLTLASMIQAEAANKDDMYMISSIFHNRLNTLSTGGYTAYGDYIKGTLGSDPTVFYPYKKNTVPSNFKSRYDTYEVQGLPAGPVGNPGMDAIEAALYPVSSNNYYFCHKPATEDSDAVAYYAATLADHNYNLSLAGLN